MKAGSSSEASVYTEVFIFVGYCMV